MSKLRIELTYQELQIIKHALKTYTARDNFKEPDDIEKEIKLLNRINEEIIIFKEFVGLSK